MHPPRAVLAAAALVAAAACGTPGASPGAGASNLTASSSPSGPVTPTPPPSAGKLMLTLRDDGRTVAVTRRTRVTLFLGKHYQWSDPTSRGARVEFGENVSDAPGVREWDLTLVETGRAVVTAEGSPSCRTTTPPCAQPDRSFTVTLVIRD